MNRLMLGLLSIVVAASALPFAAYAQTAQPAAGPAMEIPCEITIDASQLPELKVWAEKQKPNWQKWYAIIAASLPSKDYTAPKKFTVTFKPMQGVAYTVGDQVFCSGHWFKKNLNGEAAGAVVHEMVHVVQQYHGKNPGWLVEGIADYIRWFKYEPASQRPHPDPASAKYSDSYRTTAAFLDWAIQTYDKDLLVKLNAACRQGKYNDGLWKQFTGKALDDLGKEWKASLAATENK